MHYIYKIINTSNNKVYIGQTNNPELRWSQHKSNAKYGRGNQVITRAITKYGVDIFSFEVIVNCLTQGDVDFVEEQIIQQYDSRNPEKGYNVDRGGNTTPRTPEVLQKISQSLQKHYEAYDAWNKGGTLSEEWKNKISESHVGLPGTNVGKTFDEEWRDKISESNKGRVFSEEHKKNLSESHMGQIAPNRKLSLEIAQQIRREYATDLITQKQLATKYGISQNTIFNIVNGRTYNK